MNARSGGFRTAQLSVSKITVKSQKPKEVKARRARLLNNPDCVALIKEAVAAANGGGECADCKERAAELIGLDPAPIAGAEERGCRIHGLDHVVVMSPSADDSRAFYGDGLGIRLALDKTFERRGVRLIFFRLAGLTIEIGARAGVEPVPEKADRFGGLAWQVPDLDATHARLAGDGFDVSEVRPGHKEGTRVCSVRDPVHGVPTLLIQPVQPI